MGLKVGPNFEDKNRIREWVAAGKDASFISQALQIEEQAVRRFIDIHIDGVEPVDPDEDLDEEED